MAGEYYQEIEVPEIMREYSLSKGVDLALLPFLAMAIEMGNLFAREMSHSRSWLEIMTNTVIT